MSCGREPRYFGYFVAAVVLLATSLASAQAPKPAARESVLRVVPHANLVLLDPTWTSIYITRNHGYMIYDTLFAFDAEGKVRPQMVDTHTVSPDGPTWTFTLRDGLKWHDGTPVTAEDCIASLRRWAGRSGVGQQLFGLIADLSATDNKTFVMKLKAPYAYVLESLAQISEYVPFMLPKRAAETPLAQPITDYTGSGPFIFKQDEFVPGVKAVYLKNKDYVSRNEPPSLAAGGKLAKVDRVEWNKMPSQAAAVDALLAGKVDFLEEVNPRLVGKLERSRNVIVGKTGPSPFVGMARFNHTQPPFDKVDVRRAVMMAMNQADYMRAAIGPQRYWNTCFSVFPCKSPLASEAGSDFVKNGTMDTAKKALAAAGYNGAPVVMLNATDIPVIAAFNRVTAEKLKALGMKVQVVDTTWAEMTQRRADRAGWNLFHTFWSGVDLDNPGHIAFSGDPVNGWFGWAEDSQLEELRGKFARAPSPDEQKKLAAQIQERIWAIGAQAFLGEFYLPIAYRKNVEGVIVSPAQFYWNMSIKR
jgi:peptide/nickel transport system substrate-binding protein